MEGEIPILVAARGPRMLRLAAAEADIVHLALPFLGRNFTNASIDWVQKCAREAGREVDDVEIDLTVAWERPSRWRPRPRAFETARSDDDPAGC